jgi:hypothetical protein
MAESIDMHEWITAFRSSIPEEIHPSAQCICREYCSLMHRAVDAGDMTEFSRFLELMNSNGMPYVSVAGPLTPNGCAND